ncbi:MAG: ABC transporter ATP-binding protein [Actinomycetota bacterium]
MSFWTSNWNASQHQRRAFWTALALFTLFVLLPAGGGLVLAEAFRSLGEGRIATVIALAGALVVIEAGRMLALTHGVLWFARSWEYSRALLRYNMLDAQLASGGPRAGRPVRSTGEAIARFRDDTQDVASFIDGWIDLIAAAVFGVAALAVLATVDVTATLVMALPLFVVGVIAALLGNRLRRAHRIDRVATAGVTGTLGDLMSAAITIKVNDAADHALGQLRNAVDRRGSTAVRVRLYDYTIRSVGRATADIGLGLVLLATLGAFASGRLGTGEIVLFAAYGGWLGFLPRMIGLLVARGNQASVALDNMAELVADGESANVATPRRIAYRERSAPTDYVRLPRDRVALERLDVEGLGLQLGTGGIAEVSFTIERGSFTVVTGPVGAGKTTLLRAMLGLAGRGRTSGVVRWNGEEIDDRAAFLIPPQVAYLPQVPQLVSDSLRDNVLLGSPEDRLAAALALAAVEADVARMPEGADTRIGPRGVRLSGGQRQRVATARAVVQRPELLVLDDLSSALDVETELALMDNLAGAGITVLAVSHRRVALARADQVLTVRDGRLLSS